MSWWQEAWSWLLPRPSSVVTVPGQSYYVRVGPKLRWENECGPVDCPDLFLFSRETGLDFGWGSMNGENHSTLMLYATRQVRLSVGQQLGGPTMPRTILEVWWSP